jgi:hypothetical protein
VECVGAGDLGMAVLRRLRKRLEPVVVSTVKA